LCDEVFEIVREGFWRSQPAKELLTSDYRPKRLLQDGPMFRLDGTMIGGSPSLEHLHELRIDLADEKAGHRGMLSYDSTCAKVDDSA
jgi:hypothetical protein